MEMANGGIKIERGMKLPRVKAGRPAIFPWRQLKKGESFLFPNGGTATLRSTQASLAGRNTGRKFAVRTTKDGVRCWRVS